MTLKDIARESYRIDVDHGFWDGESDTPIFKAAKIALIHSELSEALEGIRKPGPDKHCPEYTVEEVELADSVIRTLIYCERYGLRLEEAIKAKTEVNRARPYKHGGKTI